MVTVYVPAEPEHASTEFSELIVLFKPRLGGLRLHVRPVAGDRVACNDTKPVNPWRPAAETVAFPTLLAGTETTEGVPIVKSRMVKVTFIK